VCQPHTPPSPLETENRPFGAECRPARISKRQRFRQKALDKQAVKTPDSYRDKMQALKRQHLTRETVRRHLEKQAGGTVLGSGVRLPDTVPAFPAASDKPRWAEFARCCKLRCCG